MTVPARQALVTPFRIVPELTLAMLLFAGALKDMSPFTLLPVDLTVLAAIGVAAVIAQRLRTLGLPRLPWALAVPLVLSALVVVSVIWSPDPAGGLSKAVRFQTLTLLAFLAGPLMLRTTTHFTRFAIALVGLATLIAVTAIHGASANEALTVTGGEHIEFAYDVGLAAVLAVGYLAWTGPRAIRVAWLAVGIYLGFEVIASGSRGVTVAVAGALCVLAWRALPQLRRLSPGSVIRIALVAAVLGALMLTLGGATRSRYETLLFSGDTSTILGPREKLYAVGATLALAQPYGAGSGGFATTARGLHYPEYTYPHNIVLEIADDYGLLAAATFVLLVLGAAYDLVRQTRRGNDVAPALLAVLLLVVVEAQFSQGLNDQRSLWFVLGLAFALPRAAAVRPVAG